jgi:hypothetical protein
MENTATIGQIHAQSRLSQRRSRSKKGQAKRCSADPAQFDFLNFRFEPLVSHDWPYLSDQSEIEKGFFTNLDHFCECYNIERFEEKKEVYPYNIFLGFQYAQECLEQINADLELMICSKDDGNVTIATAETLCTGNTLYYLPASRSYSIRKEEGNKAADLLLSLYAWLYQVVRIPSYAVESNYLNYVHDMIRIWLCESREEYDNDEFAESITEVRRASYFGKKFLKSVSNPYHLQWFSNRLNRF